MVFTMRKFIEDPALIGFLSSLNIVFNFLVGMVVSYMSDRIWTRWGRRRPFLIIGWMGLAATMLLLPLAPNMWSLVLIIFLYQFFNDIAKPYEALYNEVIPAAQRGRASTIRNVTQNLTGIVFNAVLIAQFDREYGLDALGAGFSINGELILYWVGAGLVFAAALFLLFRVRETPPAESIVRERFAFRQFFQDIFGHRQWWMVYLLYACPVIAAAGASGGSTTFMPLFMAEQLHFTKQQIGMSMGAVMVLNMILFVPVAGLLADRVSRLRLFQIGLAGQGLAHFALFLYARMATDYSVSLVAATVFVAINNAFMFLVYVLWGPLVYDYIPSNRFGTVSAGFAFAGGLAGFLVINATGIWVKAFSAVFGANGAAGSDYSSAFILQLFAGFGAMIAACYFEREAKRGRIIAYGALELKEEQRQ
jgi:Na+/melibiose symporter-like transporter